ncbi:MULTISPECIES: DUF4054 domain-containing protein [unclassified Arsenophonus]|uniref:DUF4054 domain-containing protein n=1 Tax=unclassified Arsenophonus TaxID=2627083 RepID=UPI00285D8329|nr:DUF4054 domain-containing protein [Arsenophonus sp.]MDR5614583.1 DUF4054 domain-containing protein [Arsenophonus sp.]
MQEMLKKFRDRFGEKTFTADDNKLLLYLTDAENRMDKKVWGAMYEQGLMYLTAHLLFLAGFHENSPTNGSHSADPNVLFGSQSVGDVSVSANFSGIENDWFKTSAFGEQYLALESRINNYALAVGMNW